MNILIISHRRSGTHLTIDSIRNNFSAFQNTAHTFLEGFFEMHKRYSFESIKTSLSENNNVIKTHILPDFSIYNLKENELTYLNKLFAETPKIYVYRHCFDVMVSLYEYMKTYNEAVKKMTLNEFLETSNNFDKTTEQFNRPAFWANHIKSWENSLFNKNILFVKYEDWQINYEKTLEKIGNFINLQPEKNITDIRIKNKIQNPFFNKYWFALKRKIQKKEHNKHSAILPRKGKMNDYLNYFDTNSYQLIPKEVIDFMKTKKYKTDMQL